MIYLITTIVFLSVMLLLGSVSYAMLIRRSMLAERLESLFPQDGSKLAPKEKMSGWSEKVTRLGEVVKLSPNEQSKYTKMILAAGMRKESVFLFFGFKLLMAGLLPALYFLLWAVPHGIQFKGVGILSMMAAGIVGYLLPSYWLYAKKNNRQLQVFHTLPDILDLITVCVEAGLSMDAALIRTTETPQFAKDPLAREIKVATMETRAGKPRMEALKDMAERTQVEDVKAFTTMLAQTERFGTSLSQGLRTYADALRVKRRQIAEEAAAKTTIKMIFPLILFILPALLVVILGPAIIQISKIFN